MGFFIRDLHRQIQDLHAKANDESSSLTVYRGQGMMKNEFEKMKKNYLNELFIHLLSLPCLSSLVIDCIDNVENTKHHLSSNISFTCIKILQIIINESFNRVSLPIATTEFSPIEYLVITNFLRTNELNGLLSDVPQLRRLSVHLSNQFAEKYKKKHDSIHLNHLRDVSLNIRHTTFNKFELIIKHLFKQVEVLCITSENNSTYLNEMSKKSNELTLIQHTATVNI
ncbi:unnamed protein product [Rotaria sordida]|uniref:Uncharacterized protein n=1 Tax=Rotaria sordida TaxID=392033 RepID=A0A819KNT2_9BILA|nr:unnamed protein product [Rotaria sordida]CAF3952334.1 unnamed protein product [Rotaria sordida]